MTSEAAIEQKLKRDLEAIGFKLLKLTTPGTAGVPDRMILRPRYSPGPPMFIELKAPGQKLRPLQVAVHLEWQARGCHVLPYVDSYDGVNLIVEFLKGVVQ